MRKAWLVAVLFAAIGAGGATAAERLRSADTYGPLALYSEAVAIVHNQYVDALPWTKLVDDGIRGMTEALDGDSALLDPRQARELASTTDPVDGDVGIVLGRRNGGLVIMAARDGAPARAAGLRSGDYLLKIEGVSTEAMLPIDAAARLHGSPGTEVALTVARTGWAEPRPFTLTRAKPPSDRVTARLLGDRILYVRIPEVLDTTPGELEQLLNVPPPSERATGIVLDLRDTPGGHVPAAVAVAGLFLDSQCLVARVDSRAPGQSRELRAPATAARHGQPMAVLVNHGTESAAEVLAGALQDWGRAAVVGSTTFGDASAQSLIPLPDGWSLSVTTARYLTPKGRAINGHGIVPDVASSAPPVADLGEAATSAKAGGSDPEVQLAFDLVKATRILEHAPAVGPQQAGDGVRWCGSPAA